MKSVKIFLGLGAILCVLPGLVQAEWRITQTIELKAGWNAVFLELEPDDADPGIVFSGKPVKQLMTYFPRHSPVDFIQDPDEVPWNKAGWHRWIPPGQRYSFQTNLYALQANHAYLIQCTEAFTLELMGAPKYRPRTWQPHSFNFVGFHVDAGSVSFENYFAGSRAHAGHLIFGLEDGRWKKVNPADTIAPGRAYWVWCKGGSDYPGPLEVRLRGMGDALEFPFSNAIQRMDIINRSSAPLTFTLDSLPNNSGDPMVPLSVVKKSENFERIYEPLTSYSPENPLDPGEEHTIRLTVRGEKMTFNEAESLLKITDDLGGRFYIPVSAGK